MKVLNSCILLIAFFVHCSAFADCEEERQERDKSQEDCKVLSGTSVGTMVGGSFLSGLGGLVGLIFGVPAAHNCQIATNKEENLAQCLEKALQRKRQLDKETAEYAQPEATRIKQESEDLERERQRFTNENEARVREHRLTYFKSQLKRIEIEYLNRVDELEKNCDEILAEDAESFAKRGFVADDEFATNQSRQDLPTLDQIYQMKFEELTEEYEQLKTELILQAENEGFDLREKP